MTSFVDVFGGIQGFDEVRKYIRSGEEFCKEVASYISERAECELNYAKGLSKLGAKLQKTASSSIGTLAHAWVVAATELDAEAEAHKCLANYLTEDVVKPIKALYGNQSRNRKQIESGVDKALRNLSDRRQDESKAKRQDFACTKQNELLQDQVIEMKAGRGKSSSDKDLHKLEKKKKVAEDALKKADQEYHETCQRAERARQEWETLMFKGVGQLQVMEEERIAYMQDMLNKYNNHINLVGPKLIQGCERLKAVALNIDPLTDVQKVVSEKGLGPYMPEQRLYDYYAEDTCNKMDGERRKHSLEKVLLLLKHDIEREIKGKEGIEHLEKVYRDTPNFADGEAQQEVQDKKTHANAMLDYLQASHYKVAVSLAKLEARPKPTHPLAQYIESHNDKQGMIETVLRRPVNVASGMDVMCNYVDYDNRAPGDGGPPALLYEDEFLGYDTVDDDAEVICQCRAIYDYNAIQHDELTIKTGDRINVFEKMEDGWWHGELNGRIGIFPASYVEECGAEKL